MILSLNWLKKFTSVDLPLDDIASLIGTRLVEIEKIDTFGEKYKDAIIVKVIDCRPVEDSDHLNVTRIDDGGVRQGVERDDNGLIQVVCGAPNVHTGMLAVWLPPESIVPETFGTNEPFMLGSRVLRGTKSNGMLASAKELNLSDDHEGILEIEDVVAPGTSFVAAYELDDYVLDIENKSLTHRPDVFGVIGFARELSAIQGNAFHTPEWLLNEMPYIEAGTSIETPSVTIDNPVLSDRYQAIVLQKPEQTNAARSPLHIQTYLSRSDIRPISAIVDVTNYIMLETGQPLHAFDYDKVKRLSDGPVSLHVRTARSGETLKLLSGRTIELDIEDIVVSTGDTAIALAGVMGGADTEIDESTTNIILESATFNLYNLRSTQMRHGIFSEAVTRFTKGQPAELTAPVLAKAAQMLDDIIGAKPASSIAEAYPGKRTPSALLIPIDTINDVLGTDYSVEKITETLQNVEFTVAKKDDDQGILEVTVPYWRRDINIQEDIIEEIGRINSYDAIHPVLLMRKASATRLEPFDVVRNKIRSLLAQVGANEVLTYNFVHGDLMRKVGQNPDDAYRLTNSISPELQYYRQSLTPNLLTHIHPNVRAGYNYFALFEFNKFHTKKSGLNDEGVPKEMDSLALVITRSKTEKDAMYYHAKRYIDYIVKETGLDVVFEPLEDGLEYPVTAPFEPKRSARIFDKETRTLIGVIGEYRQSVTKALKLPADTAGFEISTKALLELMKGPLFSYRASSKFPSVERDVSFQIDSDTAYDAVYETIKETLALSGFEISVEPISIYQPEGATYRNVTFKISMASFEKTLAGPEVLEIMNNVIEIIVKRYSAVVV